MSIYGLVYTTLQTYGGPAKPIGMFFRRLVIPLNFDLQIAGPVDEEFIDPSTLQFCQDSNAGIQILVYVLDQLANPTDISAASSMVFRFLRPDGTTFYKSANFLTNGMDGGLYYITTESDFIQDGTWQVQAAFKLAGDPKSTVWGPFLVTENIIAP